MKSNAQLIESGRILYESNQLLVIDKPAGIITEENPFESFNLEDLCRQYLGQKVNNPYLGVSHRLDRVTSGVLVFAKKSGTLKTLNTWFADRKIKKTYWAIISNTPPHSEDRLINHLVIDKREKKAKIVDNYEKGSKIVELIYKTLDSNSQYTLLEITPKTGRFHQIRAQLSHIGCPIVGDKKYGSSTSYHQFQIALHARSLRLPVSINGSPIIFEAPAPNHKIWKSLLK